MNPSTKECVIHEWHLTTVETMIDIIARIFMKPCGKRRNRNKWLFCKHRRYYWTGWTRCITTGIGSYSITSLNKLFCHVIFLNECKCLTDPCYLLVGWNLNWTKESDGTLDFCMWVSQTNGILKCVYPALPSYLWSTVLWQPSADLVLSPYRFSSALSQVSSPSVPGSPSYSCHLFLSSCLPWPSSSAFWLPPRWAANQIPKWRVSQR